MEPEVSNPFSVGDWVSCKVDKFTEVQMDCRYNVKWVSGSLIYLYGITGGYSAKYFEFVNDPRSQPVPAHDVTANPVDRPSHYARFEIEPIEFIMRNKLEFWQGNVVKYTLRYDAKDGVQDLKKARRYLDMQIMKLEGNPEFAK